MRIRLAALAAGLALGAVAAPAGAFEYRGCVSPTGSGGECAATMLSPAPNQIRGLDVSSDGGSVYAVGPNLILHYARDRASGGLTFKGCISMNGAGPCRDVSNSAALNSPAAVAVSPDSRNVYVASRSAVAVFDRNATTGGIAFAGCISASGHGPCRDAANGAAFDALRALAVSRDGTSIYAVAHDGRAIAKFTRSTGTGGLVFRGCISAGGAGPCRDVGDARALARPTWVALSRDDRYAYAADEDHAVATFARDDGTGDLRYQRCHSWDVEGPCVHVSPAWALAAPNSLTVVPDGTSAYVGSFNGSGALAAFARGTTDGALYFRSCLSRHGYGGCGDAGDRPLAGLYSVAASPSGRAVYATASGSDSVTRFDRDVGTGRLALGPCATFVSPGPGPCPQPGSALTDPGPLAVSPNGRTVYAASRSTGAIAWFDDSEAAIPLRTSLADLTIDPQTFTPGRRSRKAGTTVSYDLTGRASLQFTVQRAVPGRRAGGRCVKPTAANASAKTCRRWLDVKGAIRRAGTKGSDSFHFSGLIGGKPLAKGDYRLVAVTRSGSPKTSTVRHQFHVKG